MQVIEPDFRDIAPPLLEAYERFAVRPDRVAALAQGKIVWWAGAFVCRDVNDPATWRLSNGEAPAHVRAIAPDSREVDATLSVQDAFFLAMYGYDLQVVEPPPPRPCWWQAMGMASVRKRLPPGLWVPRPLVDTFSMFAWDFRGISAVLDSSFPGLAAGVVEGSLVPRLLATRISGLAERVRKATEPLATEERNHLVAAALTEYLRSPRAMEDGSIAPWGVAVSSSDDLDPYEGPLPNGRKRRATIFATALRELESEVFGERTHSPRSKARVLSGDREAEGGTIWAGMPDPAPGPEEQAEYQALCARLATLPYWEDFVEVRIHKRPLSEVARDRGISPSALSQRLKHFRKAAQAMLGSW